MRLYSLAQRTDRGCSWRKCAAHPNVAQHFDGLLETGNTDLFGVKRDTEKKGYENTVHARDHNTAWPTHVNLCPGFPVRIYFISASATLGAVGPVLFDHASCSGRESHSDLKNGLSGRHRAWKALRTAAGLSSYPGISADFIQRTCFHCTGSSL